MIIEHNSIQVRHEAPEVSDYLALRAIAGLSPMSPEGAAIGLPNSLFVVTLHIDERFIGMGRVIGDGGCFMQVVDIAVHPDLQGQGLGRRIMEEITAFLQEQAPPLTYVSLIADGEADKLYRKFGFEYTMPKSQGMHLRIRA